MAITEQEFIETLDELIEVEDTICASFYIPTHKVGGEWSADRILLRHLIQEAQKQLKARDLKKRRFRKSSRICQKVGSG